MKNSEDKTIPSLGAGLPANQKSPETPQQAPVFSPSSGACDPSLEIINRYENGELHKAEAIGLLMEPGLDFDYFDALDFVEKRGNV